MNKLNVNELNQTRPMVRTVVLTYDCLDFSEAVFQNRWYAIFLSAENKLRLRDFQSYISAK